MHVCEKLKELTVNLITIDMVAIESSCAISVSQKELLSIYQASGKSISDIADRFYVEPETVQYWIYLPMKHRKGLKEPRRSELVRYLKCSA